MNVLPLVSLSLCLLLHQCHAEAKKKDDGRGHWGEWGEWSACSATCGSGVAKIQRVWIRGPKDPEPRSDGPYVSSKVYSCINEEVRHCPQNGEWSGWLSWDECSKPCGQGKKERKRECMGVQYNGKPCEGDKKEEVSCNKDPCPVLPRNFNMSLCVTKGIFMCKSTKMCVEGKQKCDRKVQCHDGSDEVGCPRMQRSRGSIRYDLSPNVSPTLTLAGGFYWQMVSVMLLLVLTRH